MQTSQLVRLIQEMHERKYYPSYEEITNIMEEDFKLILSYDQVRNYIRNNTEFSLAIGDPMDQDRVESSEADIDDFYNKLREDVKDVDGCFVYILDKVGEETKSFLFHS